jgi:hypothetical protein
MPTQATTNGGNPSIKYVDLVDGDKTADHDIDDGFDSESTVTPVGFHNDYYNSQELVPLNANTSSSLFKQPIASVHANPKKPPARGNSESIGSLDTDATGSAGGDDDSDDHDYYNEFSPTSASRAATRVRSSEQVLLQPAQLVAGNCEKSSPVWVAKSRAN